MKIERIQFVSPVEDVNLDNDNIDVHVYLEDSRVYSFLFATPNNLYWCMTNEDTTYFFSFPPPVFVNEMTTEHVPAALEDMARDDSEKWFGIYGVLQTTE